MLEPIQFRAIVESDPPMLFEWLQRPHVAEWWDRPASVEDVRAKYLPRLEPGSTVIPYLAYLDGEVVGYFQSCVPALEADGWWLGVTDLAIRGVDQFVADEANLNRGLGTTLIRAFLRTLFEDPAVSSVQTDPSPMNRRAIRCYEKAGFRDVWIVDTPDGEALLMVAIRPEANS